jgi:hypothetical protein
MVDGGRVCGRCAWVYMRAGVVVEGRWGRSDVGEWVSGGRWGMGREVSVCT